MTQVAAATLLVGADFVPLDPGLTESVWFRVLNRSAARFAFVSEIGDLDKVQAVRPDLAALELVFLFRQPEDRVAAATLVDHACTMGSDQLSNGGEEKTAAESDAQGAGRIVFFPAAGEDGKATESVLSGMDMLSRAEKMCDRFRMGEAEIIFSAEPPWEALQLALALRCIRQPSTLVQARAGPLGPDLLEVRPTFLVAANREIDSHCRDLVARVSAGPRLRRKLFTWGLGYAVQSQKAGEAAAQRPSLKSRLADRFALRVVRDACGSALKRILVTRGSLAPEAADCLSAAGIELDELKEL
jgi:hypothetical protein